MGCVSVRHVPTTTPRALADLTEISAQIETAVVLDREGTVVAATVDDDKAGRLAASALELLRTAEEHRAKADEAAGELAQLDVALHDGSVFVVRDGDRLIAATTTPEPTVGLVFYDLKNCLRSLGEETGAQAAEEQEPKQKPKATRARAKKGDAKP
jgi:predicted regulator of Ras-like GTPase activity (Roadblock/LC7/MglB family)